MKLSYFKKPVWLSIAVHTIVLSLILFIPSYRKKMPPLTQPTQPMQLIEEPILEEPSPSQPKITESKEPDKKTIPVTEPAPKKPVPAEKEPEQKSAPVIEPSLKKPVPVEKVVKKRKIIEPEQKKSLKEKIEEKLNKLESADTTTAAAGSLKKKTDLKVKDFPFKWYLDIVQHKVKNNWQEPSKILASYKELANMVSFRLHKDGSVTDIMLKEHSQNNLLDSSALKAVKDSAPFPPLPENYNKDYLDIIIEFNLSQ